MPLTKSIYPLLTGGLFAWHHSHSEQKELLALTEAEGEESRFELYTMALPFSLYVLALGANESPGSCQIQQAAYRPIAGLLGQSSDLLAQVLR